MTSRSETTNPVTAMREIETIRETLIQFLDLTGATAGTKNSRSIKALATLEARIAELEACALDLTKVPEGFGWIVHSLRDGNIKATIGTDHNPPHDPGREYEAIADTPRAALEAAIGRIKG